MTHSTRPLLSRLLERIDRLSRQQRYEDAAAQRDRAAALLRATDRVQRMAALSRVRQLVAARPRDGGGWELHVVRFGRLAGAATVPAGAHPQPYVEALVAAAETVQPAPPPLPAASTEEAECVLHWLEQSGARLVELDGVWSCPSDGAAGMRSVLDAGRSDRRAVAPFADRRALRPVGSGGC